SQITDRIFHACSSPFCCSQNIFHRYRPMHSPFYGQRRYLLHCLPACAQFPESYRDRIPSRSRPPERLPFGRPLDDRAQIRTVGYLGRPLEAIPTLYNLLCLRGFSRACRYFLQPAICRRRIFRRGRTHVAPVAGDETTAELSVLADGLVV